MNANEQYWVNPLLFAPPLLCGVYVSAARFLLNKTRSFKVEHPQVSDRLLFVFSTRGQIMLVRKWVSCSISKAWRDLSLEAWCSAGEKKFIECHQYYLHFPLFCGKVRLNVSIIAAIVVTYMQQLAQTEGTPANASQRSLVKDCSIFCCCCWIFFFHLFF